MIKKKHNFNHKEEALMTMKFHQKQITVENCFKMRYYSCISHKKTLIGEWKWPLVLSSLSWCYLIKFGLIFFLLVSDSYHPSTQTTDRRSSWYKMWINSCHNFTCLIAVKNPCGLKKPVIQNTCIVNYIY